METVAHRLHVQCYGACHAALSMEATRQLMTKFSVLTDSCVICPYRSMHVTQASMSAMKNTAIFDTLIPLHLGSDKAGLSPVAGV